MTRIAELSKDVAKNYREEKKGKLQRTFVTASSAAESRYAGICFYSLFNKNTNSYNINVL